MIDLDAIRERAEVWLATSLEADHPQKLMAADVLALVGRIQELEADHDVYQRNITDEYQRRIKAEAEQGEAVLSLVRCTDLLRKAEAERDRAEEQRGEAEARATRLLEAWEKAEARLVLAEKARRAEQVRANKAEAERDTALDVARQATEDYRREEEAARKYLAERDTLREALYELKNRAELGATVRSHNVIDIADAALTQGAGE